MTVSSTSTIDKLNNSGSSASTTKKDNQTVDQTTFLKLLTTQMQSQDPFNPVDNSQMVAQMAQFSSVAGIAEMNSSLKGIASDITASRIGDASGWIGRAALVPSDTVNQMSNGSYNGTITIPSDATNVSVSLVDDNGQILYNKLLGAQKAGDVPFSWEGTKDAEGNPVAMGDLKVRVSAVDAKGDIDASVATWTMISGVQSPASGTTKLVTGLGLVAPSDTLSLS